MNDNALQLESMIYAWIFRLFHDQNSKISWNSAGAYSRVEKAASNESIFEYWIRYTLLNLAIMILLIVRLL
jgi:hypothetical protein